MYEYKSPLRVESVSDPQVGVNDVLIKVKVCGVCFSDVKIWTGKSPQRPTLPHILGHEVSGTVAGVGKNVSYLNEGDPVIAYLYDTCDKCMACKTGKDNHCMNMGPLLGFNRSGGFADYVSVPSKNVFRIPDNLDLTQAALLPDAVITPYHAIVEKAQVRFNETAMIVGMGGLGLNSLQILKLIGARVIAVSRTESKLDMAKKLGADQTVNSKSADLIEESKRATDGYGVDYVFDTVATAETIDQDIRSLKRGGKAVLLAYESEPTPIVTRNLMIGLASIQSTRGGTRQNLRDLIRLASEGKLKSIVTHEYSLDEANTALTKLSKGEVTGRVTLKL
jgi:2-desacetyl-2-hydroxyethyl bacteriochlorophyllide A dehydrogenase